MGIVIATVTILTMKNLFLICYSFRLYRKNWQNFFELLLIIDCVAYVILFLTNESKDLRVHFGALALFGVWGNFTLLLGKVPSAGIYIIMITGRPCYYLCNRLLLPNSRIHFDKIQPILKLEI